MGLVLPGARRVGRDIGELGNAPGVRVITQILDNGRRMRAGLPNSHHSCRSWGILDCNDGIGAALSDVLGLQRQVVFVVANLVPATHVGDSGMVDSLCRVTQWLARDLVLSGSAVCAAFIHDCRANERGLLHYWQWKRPMRAIGLFWGKKERNWRRYEPKLEVEEGDGGKECKMSDTLWLNSRNPRSEGGTRLGISTTKRRVAPGPRVSGR